MNPYENIDWMLNDDKPRIRVIAMNWWDNLSALRKTQICDTNTDLVGYVRRWESLTGSEIEMLYRRFYDSEKNAK